MDGNGGLSPVSSELGEGFLPSNIPSSPIDRTIPLELPKDLNHQLRSSVVSHHEIGEVHTQLTLKFKITGRELNDNNAKSAITFFEDKGSITYPEGWDIGKPPCICSTVLRTFVNVRT